MTHSGHSRFTIAGCAAQPHFDVRNRYARLCFTGAVQQWCDILFIRCGPREGKALRRRDFITLLGGAAAGWPLAARAQQQTAKPLIGFLNSASPISYTPMVATFQDGLNQLGFDSHNVAFEYHWAEGDYDLLSGPQGGSHNRRRWSRGAGS